MGSLIAALASYLDARHAGGQWLLRVEDIDPPREEAGAASAILHSLRCHGMLWDEAELFQHERHAAYEAALQQLAATGLLFHCCCSRRVLGPGGACGGRCAQLPATPDQATSLRVQVERTRATAFDDLFQGPQQKLLAQLPADFVVRRKDGLFAYHLAVTVDDHYQRISHVIRGSDLLDSTPLHLYLQSLLGYTHPRYGHCPVLVDGEGNKLSKQRRAEPLNNGTPASNLRSALAYLRQPPPPPSVREAPALLEHARQHWSRAALQAVREVS